MAHWNIQFRVINTHTTVYQMQVEADHPPTTEDIRYLHEPVVKLIQEQQDSEHRMDWSISYDAPPSITDSPGQPPDFAKEQ